MDVVFAEYVLEKLLDEQFCFELNKRYTEKYGNYCPILDQDLGRNSSYTFGAWHYMDAKSGQ